MARAQFGQASLGLSLRFGEQNAQWFKMRSLVSQVGLASLLALLLSICYFVVQNVTGWTSA